MYKFTPLDINILNEIQYNFPINERPYDLISEKLKLNTHNLLNKISHYKTSNIIKNIGFLINYRSIDLISALVGCKIKNNVIDKFTLKIRCNASIKHCYVRDDKNYNIWYTIKAQNEDELLDSVFELCTPYTKKFVILKSERTYKLSVKYDLCKGVSWSKPHILPKKIINISDLGINKEIVNRLRDIPVSNRPFKDLAIMLDTDENTIIALIREMIKKNIILDWGAILNGEKIGFKNNAMVMMTGDSNICKKLSLYAPEATHIILRKCIYGKWDYNVYFMIHGVARSYLDNLMTHIAKILNIDAYKALFSSKNLKG